jgi:hypothetical protein
MDMNEELDRQNDALDKLEKGVDQALDEFDNVNIKMKNVLTKVWNLFVRHLVSYFPTGHEGRSIHAQLRDALRSLGSGIVYRQHVLVVQPEYK